MSECQPHGNGALADFQGRAGGRVHRTSERPVNGLNRKTDIRGAQ